MRSSNSNADCFVSTNADSADDSHDHRYVLVRLSPAQGYLYVSTPTSNHAFKIDEPNSSDNVCPKYNLKVVDASDKHAVSQKSSPRIEYKPGRFFSGVPYYLYDVPTATAREIWKASATGSKDPLPLADPVPSMKIIADGSRFDWVGLHPGRSSSSASALHNEYVRKTEAGKPVLVCVDKAAQGPAVEDEMCEGGVLPRIN
jgi:hypothetical protein